MSGFLDYFIERKKRKVSKRIFFIISLDCLFQWEKKLQAQNKCRRIFTKNKKKPYVLYEKNIIFLNGFHGLQEIKIRAALFS